MEHAAVIASLTQNLALSPDSARILVVGLGITGISVAYFLRKLGYSFVITDSRENPPLLDEFVQRFHDAPMVLGGFDENVFKVSTHLVVSPGISLKEKAIAEAICSGIKVISDIDLFVCSVNAPIVAITGSNGKSTVTTMVGDMVAAAGKRVGVGGNIGTPALDLVDNKNEVFVLELSSFQLERTSLLRADAATVLNVTADHLDRHASLEQYAQEKSRIFNGDGVMVINCDDSIVKAMQRTKRRTLTFSIGEKADFHLMAEAGREYLMYQDRKLVAVDELPFVGRHNLANALAALALGQAIGLAKTAMCSALRKFEGLAHRMQRVAEINGITWINDSKATNIGACVAALQGYNRNVVLIAGGDAKGADMKELTPTIQEKVKCVVLMGKDARLIKQALMRCVPVYCAETMQEAVKLASGLATKGDSVLLSPACSSLDQYVNYQDRGNQFSRAVMELMA